VSKRLDRRCTLSNIGNLAGWPITSSPPRNEEDAVETIVQRLASLIYNLEVNRRCFETAVASKWYLHHLVAVPINRSYSCYIDPFIERLNNSIYQWEAQHGQIQSNHLAYIDNRLSFAGQSRNWLLFGPRPPYVMGVGDTIRGTPLSDLFSFIHYYMWKLYL
jgi:hypothetical protein